ncbi:MAG: thioredoxin family protein [Candidatus Calescibacterium sp.]|nr:thioredoxin family protein [Candidatus Calescibacterium sp.]
MFLSEKDRAYLKDRFSKEMINDVKVTVYTKSIDCEYCPETEQLMKELAQTSDKIKLEILNVIIDKNKIGEEIERTPMIIIGDKRIKFSGIPAGYEFAVLVEDIIEVSRSEPLLSPTSVEKIKKIDKPIDIKVFVTPTCPYCPRMVKYAHSAALINPNINSEMIEATEFPELSNAYSVYGVPKTIINDTIEIEGAVPEEHFVEELLRAYNAA